MRPSLNLSLVLALLLATFSLSSCGGGGGSGDDTSGEATSGACATLGLKVINGESCSSNRSPIAVILTTFKNGDIALCSGTLITPSKVLTAAHCFPAGNTDSAIAIGNTVFGVTKGVTHPAFDPNSPLGVSSFDLAVLTIDATSSIAPVPILASDRVSTGERFTIFGYGNDENGADAFARDLNDRLKSANMIVSDSADELFFGDFDALGATICEGDSGGPAVQVSNGVGTIVGVSSFDVAGCGPGSTSGFGAVGNSSNLALLRRQAPDASYR